MMSKGRSWSKRGGKGYWGWGLKLGLVKARGNMAWCMYETTMEIKLGGRVVIFYSRLKGVGLDKLALGRESHV